MARGCGKLCGTIKPDNDHVWNGFGIIEDLVGSFEPQIDDQQTALIYRKYRYKKMTRNKEDNDV